MNILTSVCSSWHSWGFWSHTAGTYFWFCHANYISPAVPVKQGSSSSQHQNRVCGAEGRRASVEGKGKMSQGSSCASYLPLGWNPVFSSVVSFQMPWANWVLRQDRAGAPPRVQLLCAALRWSGWSHGPCRQGAEMQEMGWRIQWEHLLCFTGRARANTLLCPISPVHTLAEGEEQGYGVVYSLFFPSSSIPLCCSFLCWLSKPDSKLVKAIFQKYTATNLLSHWKSHISRSFEGT